MKKFIKKSLKNHEKIVENGVKKRTAKIPKMWPWLQREAIFWNPPGLRSAATADDWFPPEPPSYKCFARLRNVHRPKGRFPSSARVRSGGIKHKKIMKKSWKDHKKIIKNSLKSSSTIHSKNHWKIIKNEVKKRTAKIPKLWPWLQREAIFWNPPGRRSGTIAGDWFPPEPPSL